MPYLPTSSSVDRPQPHSAQRLTLRRRLAAGLSTCLMVTAPMLATPMARAAPTPETTRQIDLQLKAALASAGFSGRIDSRFPALLQAALGRPIDLKLADLGRKLFFDPIHALGDDNTCAGCHAPNAAFGDTQSIAIGVQSNRIVGPNRAGPRE